MKRLYLKPETIRMKCEVESFIAASPKTEWEMNPDGNNGENIGGGTGHDPDADAKSVWGMDDLWEE